MLRLHKHIARLTRNNLLKYNTSAVKSVSMASSSGLGKFNCRRLDGKIAVITASTAGIGYAIAERLGHEGAHVVVSSRKQKQVDTTVETLSSQGLKVTGLTCHVGSKDDRRKLFNLVEEKFGGLDILVSNAGINPSFGQILDTKEEVWDKIFDVNVKAAFLLCQEAVPLMKKRGGGSVVFVSSIGGYDPFPMIAPYSISKTALLGLVQGLVPQLSSLNIRVNAIAPGIIKTNFSQALLEPGEEAVAADVPLNRVGRPEECAGAVAFLVSDDASYITGETIVMSGGKRSRL